MWRRIGRRIHLAALFVALFAAAAIGQSKLDNQDRSSHVKPLTLADISIVQAWFGDLDGAGKDVTNDVQRAFYAGDRLRPTTDIFGDTAPNHHKVLWLKYQVRGIERVFIVPDGSNVSLWMLLGDVPKLGSVKLTSANYQGVDVTPKIQTLLDQGVVAIPVSLGVFAIPDPAFGQQKTLKLQFKLEDGDTRTLTGQEGDCIPLQSLVPLKVLPEVKNGSFDSEDPSCFATEQVYKAASNDVLHEPGTFTIAEGILRPFQLEHSIRADFVEHTNRSGSMALWINPVVGRQPVLLWEQKVAANPNTDYIFSCQAADVSDSDSFFATIMLEVDDVRGKPVVLQELFKWKQIRMPIHTGSAPSVCLKIWRDVIPYDASGPAALGLDDIAFGPAK